MMFEKGSSGAVTAERIIQLGIGFWGAKALMSAVELGVFNELAQSGPLDLTELSMRLGLHPRGARDFLDALVALKLLSRGVGGYWNTPAAEQFLDRRKRQYLGGLLLMASERLYPSWGSLTQALQTGLPQSEVKGGGDYFKRLYSDPERLRLFLQAMTAMSLRAGSALAMKFRWNRCRQVVDLGTAQGAVPVELALAHPHLACNGCDLPMVRPFFEEYVRSHGLEKRVRFMARDFFSDPLPEGDVYILGHVLHDWDLAGKRALLAKAYSALPVGGALIVHDTLIDDERCENALALLMSLNMLLQTPGGFDYTARDCIGWLREAGFCVTEVDRLADADRMIVAIKE